jgi:nicotinamidase-related amidase
MSPSQPLSRSPEMMNADDTALVVIDVQEKLIPLLADHKRIVWNIGRLLAAAEIEGVPALATEQYPQGLGPTVAELAARLPAPPAKVEFSCGACGELFAPLLERGIFRLLLCGIETHVCIQQSALDLLAAGFRVYIAVDAVGARRQIDHTTALARLEASGATLTTTEAAVFEWRRAAGTPQFKQLSQLIKQPAPPE